MRCTATVERPAYPDREHYPEQFHHGMIDRFIMRGAQDVAIASVFISGVR